MRVRKQVKTLLKILSEAPSQQKHLGADTKDVQILKNQNKRKSENKSCQNDKNSNTNQFPLFPLKMFLMIFRGARNISLAAGVILATGDLSPQTSAELLQPYPLDINPLPSKSPFFWLRLRMGSQQRGQSWWLGCAIGHRAM